MRAGIRHVLGVVAVTQLALWAAGCSHDTLSGSSQDLIVTFTPSPPGAGRYTGVGSDKATFEIRQLRVVPADPVTAALYEADGKTLSFRFQPFDPDNHPHLLEETTESEFAHIALSSGTYRVQTLAVTPLELIDDNVDPNAAGCIERIAVIDRTSVNPNIPDVISLDFPNAADTPANLTFTVHPGQTKLQLKVNVPGLIAGYESSFTCQPNCFFGFPCLTAFSEPNFKAALLANISIE
jgi:hypothetical protein